jgi:hypothetical protein
MRTDNSYRSYECLLNADIFVLTMKTFPDTVTMCLLKADMFSLREEHVTKSMQGLSSACGNTVFFQIVTLTDLLSRCRKMKLVLDMTIVRICQYESLVKADCLTLIIMDFDIIVSI